MSDANLGLEQSVSGAGATSVGFKPSCLPSGRSPLWPLRLRALLRFFFGFPGYFLPFTIPLLALAVWETRFPGYHPGDSLISYYGVAWARNAASWILFAGSLHLWFNIFKRQGIEAKYVDRWDRVYNKKYTFGYQHLDNIFWSLMSGVTVWTFYETVSVFIHAGRPSIFDGSVLSAVYFVALFPLNTMWVLIHFYFQHRLLHHPWLYERFHSIHHRNTNTGPLSGLSMHWVEHFVYLSAVCIFWIIPCDPIHYQYSLLTLALLPAYSHAGFDIWRFGKRSVPLGDYEHFLHHRLFNVNFGGSSLLPLDFLLGTHHDGSAEADKRMRERLRKREQVA